jgi:nitroreductase
MILILHTLMLMTEDSLTDLILFSDTLWLWFSFHYSHHQYAAACAAVQNVLLSLHAEQIATKWATGPVIKTRAFRKLVGASLQDRIVGLIMVGLPKQDDKFKNKPRRFHREWEEFLEDL